MEDMHKVDPKHWRLIRSPSASGAWNMALDEALLESCGEGLSLPTMRLYAWEPACLSLGYAQRIEDVDLGRLQEQGWDLVRRPTGGRAILHSDELTYSIAGPERHPLLQGGVLACYRRLSAGLVAALQQLALQVEVQAHQPQDLPKPLEPVCFEIPSAYEITVGGKKLIGSAQVRRRNGMLQHGSLPLYGDIARICQALSFADEVQRIHAAKRVRQRAHTVEAASGRTIRWQEAAQAFQDGFQEAFDIRWEPGEPSDSELARAQELVQERFGAEAWSQRV